MHPNKKYCNKHSILPKRLNMIIINYSSLLWINLAFIQNGQTYNLIRCILLKLVSNSFASNGDA